MGDFYDIITLVINKGSVRMAPKNIDETIKKLLQGYAQWCYTILQKEHKRLQKQYFPTKEDQAKAFQEYTRTKQAYEYLLEIAKEPKKYLYSGKDLIYSDTVDYNKLLPILNGYFDKSQKHLLVRLSEKIAQHVKYGKNDHEGNWIYYGPQRVGFMSYSPSDLEAEWIINANKSVQLWTANDFVAAIKGFAFPTAFAVDAYKKESR